MNNVEFMNRRVSIFERRGELLLKKEKEYSKGKNRLDQFYRAAKAQGILPTEALVGMMTKHFTSIADMAKNPLDYTSKQWHSKLDDLANYCDLLDALVYDMDEGEEE